MVPFIVTLLVLSTLNVDAQTGFATFKDEDGLPFGVMSLEPVVDLINHVDVSMAWDVIENSIVANNSGSFRMFIMMSKDCTGFSYGGNDFNMVCNGGELNCYSEGILFEDLGSTVSFRIPHIPIEDLVSYSLAIYQGAQVPYCAVINQYLVAATIRDKVPRDELSFQLVLTSGPEDDGIVQVSARWDPPTFNIARIGIHENPVIDGECSTTGGIFNHADHSGACAYGSISCELPNYENFFSDDGVMEGVLPYMMFDHLFCHAERSVVVILEGGEAHCYNFVLREGAVVGCPSQSPSATTTTTATRSATTSASASASIPVVEEDIDESSAFAHGPYQGFFFAVVLCLCAFYFQ